MQSVEAWSSLGRLLFWWSVYILYLDDSGSDRNPGDKYVILAGICVFERQVHWLSKELDEAAARLRPADPHSLEFRGQAIWSGKGFWRSRQKEERRRVLGELLDVVVRSHRTTATFAAVVDKRVVAPSDPLEHAFEQLCMRFDRFLQRHYLAGNPQRGLIVIDKSSYETVLQTLARDFKVVGHRWGVLRNLCDVPMFVDSRATRLIQLADIIAYVLRRRYEYGEVELARKLVDRWDSSGGIIHGLVHVRSRDEQCFCPGCYTPMLSGEPGDFQRE